jgi:hypothetical protein
MLYGTDSVLFLRILNKRSGTCEQAVGDDLWRQAERPLEDKAARRGIRDVRVPRVEAWRIHHPVSISERRGAARRAVSVIDPRAGLRAPRQRSRGLRSAASPRCVASAGQTRRAGSVLGGFGMRTLVSTNSVDKTVLSLARRPQ